MYSSESLEPESICAIKTWRLPVCHYPYTSDDLCVYFSLLLAFNLSHYIFHTGQSQHFSVLFVSGFPRLQRDLFQLHKTLMFSLLFLYLTIYRICFGYSGRFYFAYIAKISVSIAFDILPP